MCRGTRDTRFELLPTRRRVMVPDCVQSRKSGTVSCPAWSFVIQRTVTRLTVSYCGMVDRKSKPFPTDHHDHGQT
ncbi:hypothetical protein QBC32DRAFT_347096, partial [Pseudoneurospora amorphoporcata]